MSKPAHQLSYLASWTFKLGKERNDSVLDKGLIFSLRYEKLDVPLSLRLISETLLARANNRCDRYMWKGILTIAWVSGRPWPGELT